MDESKQETRPAPAIGSAFGVPVPTPTSVAKEDDRAGRWSEAGLAALFLRLMGVYFAAWGVISGVDKLVSIIHTANAHDLDYALSVYGTYLVYPAMELVVGFYFVVGGQWVYNKILAPIRRRKQDDPDEIAHD
jgi:hypothetical protein